MVHNLSYLSYASFTKVKPAFSLSLACSISNSSIPITISFNFTKYIFIYLFPFLYTFIITSMGLVVKPPFYLFFNHCERNFSPTVITVADLFFKALKLKFINKIRTNLAAKTFSINTPETTVFSFEIFFCITH